VVTILTLECGGIYRGGWRASVSATENHAVVLAFVDQTLTMGNAAPTNTASSVRVTVDKVGGRWLISQLDPI
jgi:Mce-associated membrane protein